MKRAHKIRAAILFLFLSSSLLAQETLPAQVYRHNSDFTTKDLVNYIPADLATVTNDANIVVLGRVLKSKSHLDKTEGGVQTEYEVQTREIFKPAVPPNQVGTLVVQRVGGEMVIDGHKVVHSVAHCPLFESGHDYILFLRLDRESGAYYLAHGPYSFYELKNGRVERASDLGPYNKKYDDMPYDEFAGLIRSALAATSTPAR